MIEEIYQELLRNVKELELILMKQSIILFILNRIWSYFIQICEGIHYLHENKILHRDIKPANCFITSEGGIKLGDFNVSKIVKNNCLVKTQIGTPYYMSPEIWKNRAYDSKCDIWSLGCILYEMASLRPPFLGNSIEELGRRIQVYKYTFRVVLILEFHQDIVKICLI